MLKSPASCTLPAVDGVSWDPERYFLSLSKEAVKVLPSIRASPASKWRHGSATVPLSHSRAFPPILFISEAPLCSTYRPCVWLSATLRQSLIPRSVTVCSRASLALSLMNFASLPSCSWAICVPRTQVGLSVVLGFLSFLGLIVMQDITARHFLQLSFTWPQVTRVQCHPCDGSSVPKVSSKTSKSYLELKEEISLGLSERFSFICC